jgi:hypothetical protein
MSSDPIRAGQLEIRYLVDGSASGGLGVFELTVPPGSNVPPAHSHRDNEGTQTARALVVLTPDIGAQYFRDVAAVVNAGGPPDRAKLMEVMSRYGLKPAAPAQPAASAR